MRWSSKSTTSRNLAEPRAPEFSGFPKLGVPFWKVPIIRTIAFWGLYWGPSRNYHQKIRVVESRQVPILLTLNLKPRALRFIPLGFGRKCVLAREQFRAQGLDNYMGFLKLRTSIKQVPAGGTCTLSGGRQHFNFHRSNATKDFAKYKFCAARNSILSPAIWLLYDCL